MRGDMNLKDLESKAYKLLRKIDKKKAEGEGLYQKIITPINKEIDDMLSELRELNEKIDKNGLSTPKNKRL